MITVEHERESSDRLGTGGVNLVKVAHASDQAEAELLQSLLNQGGIPSTLRRSRGFDVPGFLAAGPRDVLVLDADQERACEALTPVTGASPTQPQRRPHRQHLLSAGLIALTLIALVICLEIDLLT